LVSPFVSLKIPGTGAHGLEQVPMHPSMSPVPIGGRFETPWVGWTEFARW
jgi:hypothetical protein